MDQQQIIAGYEGRAKGVGLTIGTLCKEAGLAASTFSRWKASDKNTKPIGMTLASMSAIERVLASHEATRRFTNPAQDAAA